MQEDGDDGANGDSGAGGDALGGAGGVGGEVGPLPGPGNPGQDGLVVIAWVSQ